ncbi:MAG TPA: DUF2298 domain-containing protein [Ktedonobacterales bacterium]|jgi:YYY domain-containing protein
MTMGVLFVWWLLAELLGVITLPLAAVVFTHLPDRGWGLARPFGLLVLGWLVWFPLSIVTALPYSRGWIAGTLIVVALGNAALLWRWPAVGQALRDLARREWRYVVAGEAVFAGSLALMGWLRSFTPGVVDQEKFMDVAFLSSIWRAPHLPPPDPWLAGWPINYYYFGHFLVATLAKLIGTPPPVAFNASVALIFALTASAVFAVSVNLVAALRGGPWRGRAGSPTTPPPRMLSRALPYGLTSVACVLILGNLAAAQQWWQLAVALAEQAPRILSNPWAWWTHPDLWLQFNWWNPSRVVPNTINEFPAFSFILADLHAHVLALPFAALALGVALNRLFARGDGLRAFGVGAWRVLALGGTALVLGALYAINGWDLPTYLGLALLALGIQQWMGHERRGGAIFWLDLAAPAILLVALTVFLFLPFYRGYDSPAGGLGLVPAAARAPVGYVVAIFGLPLFLVGSLLVVRLGAWLAARRAARDLPGVDGVSAAWAAAQTGLLAPARVFVAVVVALLALLTLVTQGFTGWTLLWSVLILGGGALLALWPLVPRWAPGAPRRREQAELFIWCVVGTCAALVAVCEVLYLRDVFDGGDLFRMNTVFKFYYQVWLMLGVVSGPVLALLLPAVRARIAAFVEGGVALAVAGVRRTPLRTAGAAEMSRLALAAPGGAAGGGAAGRFARGAAQGDTEAAGDLDPDESGARVVSEIADEPDAADAGDAADEAPGGLSPNAPTMGGGRPGGLAGLRWLGAGGTLIWAAALLVLLAAALVYPLQASAARTVNFTLPRTLDGTAYMANDPLNAGDAQAIAWLNNPAHVAGDPVIVEAAGGEYSHYGRVSAFTGLPTILNWSGHEYQWRANWLRDPSHAGEVDQRTNAINQIYTNTNPQVVLQMLEQYHARYVYVGAAERATYPTADLSRFARFLRTVYSAGGVTIYAVK